MSKPDYEREFLFALRSNAREVLALFQARDQAILEKVEKFAQKYEFTLDQVKEKIVSDPMFAVVFGIDPAKQGIHENIAAAHIEALPGVENFKQLAHGGKNSLSILRGAVMSLTDAKKLGGKSSAKTIDFSWNSCNKLCA